LGAEGKWTDDRFRLPGVDPALRVAVEPFAKVLVLDAEVDEARSLEVEVEDDVILDVELDEARFLEVEEEAILEEVELARFCFEIDLILVISSHHDDPIAGRTLRTLSDVHQHTYPPFEVHSIPIPLLPDQRS